MMGPVRTQNNDGLTLKPFICPNHNEKKIKDKERCASEDAEQSSFLQSNLSTNRVVSDYSDDYRQKELSNDITSDSGQSPVAFLKHDLLRTSENLRHEFQKNEDNECTNVSNSSGTSLENKIPNHYKGPRIVIGHNNKPKSQPQGFIQIQDCKAIQTIAIDQINKKWASPQNRSHSYKLKMPNFKKKSVDIQQIQETTELMRENKKVADEKNESRKKSQQAESSLSRLLALQTWKVDTRKKLSFVDNDQTTTNLLDTSIQKRMTLGVGLRRQKLRGSIFLTNQRIFHILLKFLDFMGLFKLMQLQRDYRWDLMQKGYQPKLYWVHKFIRKRMKQILLSHGGLRSTVERRHFWIFNTKITKLKSDYDQSNSYALLIDKCQQMQKIGKKCSEITKDISRTFPELQFFQKEQIGQKKLVNILQAIANFQVRGQDGTIGYTQGMNFIAATSLVHLQQHEENTFWFMIALLCQREFAKIFDFSQSGKFRVLCFQLEVLSYVYVPKVFEHFQKKTIPTDIYASNWFITLFSNDLPFDMTPSVIDVYLLEGNKGLLRIALGLLWFIQDELLEMKQYDDLMVFMSNPSAREEIFKRIDQHSLFSKTSTFKITNNLLHELERLHQIDQKLQPTQNNYDSRQQFQPVEENPELTAFRKKFDKIRHFKRLQLLNEDKNTEHNYSWHVMQLTPDQAEDFMNNGYSDFDLEDIQRFYNDFLRNRELSDILDEIEHQFNLCDRKKTDSGLGFQKRTEITKMLKNSDQTLSLSPETNFQECKSPAQNQGSMSLSLVQSEESVKFISSKLKQKGLSPPISARNHALITEVESMFFKDNSKTHQKMARKIESKPIQRRQETEIDDQKWPQFDIINVRKKVNQFSLGQTLSPKTLCSNELDKSRKDWNLVDSNFEYEQKASIVCSNRNKEQPIHLPDLGKQTPKLSIIEQSNKRPLQMLGTVETTAQQKVQPNDSYQAWTSMFAQQLSNLISFNKPRNHLPARSPSVQLHMQEDAQPIQVQVSAQHYASQKKPVKPKIGETQIEPSQNLKNALH